MYDIKFFTAVSIFGRSSTKCRVNLCKFSAVVVGRCAEELLLVVASAGGNSAAILVVEELSGTLSSTSVGGIVILSSSVFKVTGSVAVAVAKTGSVVCKVTSGGAGLAVAVVTSVDEEFVALTGAVGWSIVIEESYKKGRPIDRDYLL